MLTLKPLRHSSFSIICYFLPNRSRTLPALTEKSKIKKLPLLGLNPHPPDHVFNALLTVLARNLLFACVIQPLKSSSIDF